MTRTTHDTAKTAGQTRDRKQEFLEHLLQYGVLRFGTFKTKSGRLSPYFFNTGMIRTGTALTRFVDAFVPLCEEFPKLDSLFGPAYKGIPLAVSLAEKLSTRWNREVAFTFNRKAVKDHGEGGTLVGLEYTGRETVVIVEDVLTAGTSVRESVALLAKLKIKPVAVIVGIDREERGRDNLRARVELEKEFGISVRSVIQLSEIIDRLHNKEVLGKVWIDDAVYGDIQSYRKMYC